ncbi:MAG: glycoside hydrolase, partial [Clostridiaceae bacterium]|nr:glycoside hydrolase [Clostridiaceae bacterium]
MKKYIIRGLLIIIILASICGLGYYFYYQFYMPNNDVVVAFQTDRTNLVIEDKIIIAKNPPMIVDEEILLPIEIIREYIDKDIFWDDNLKKVTITTKNRVIRMKTDELEAFVNNNPVNLNIPAKENNGTVYIPIEFLSEFYGIDIRHEEENNVVILDPTSSMIQIAKPINSKAVIRTGRSIKEPIIREYDFLNIEENVEYDPHDENSNSTGTGENISLISSQDTNLISSYIDIQELDDNVLRIFKEYDNWYKVRTKDGVIGYIEKKFVVVEWIFIKNRFSLMESEVIPWKPEKGRINLVWEMMYSVRPNLQQIGKIEGLDVISPTWFQVEDDQGNIINRSDATYVEWAHQNGYKIWALFSNDFQDIDATSRFLNNTDARDNAIRQILTYASLYKLDGINIDFENIYKEDKDALTQFVREITPLLREQGLVVSIDVNIPGGSDTWSKCYDHKALGEIVDYVMLMTYDQHWAGSPVAGSVAQLSWVENNLVKVLELVPREKLLLGLPFYIRLWQEEAVAGTVKVTNPSVLTMKGAREVVNKYDATVEWDEESGQFYAEYEKDGKTYKMWIEDENSINLKSSLVHKYKLAGTAAWKRSD